MYKKQSLFIFFALICLINCQLLYPEAHNGASSNLSSANVSLIQRNTEDNRALVSDVISKGVLNLALSLDKILSSKAINSDVKVYSPVGIAGALALVLLGSHGKTFEELSSVLGLQIGIDIQNNSEPVHEQLGRLLEDMQRNANTNLGAKVKFATAIFVQNDYPIRSVYKQKSEAVYKSEILNLDFQQNSANAQNVINAWVADRTNSKITNILAEPPPVTTRVIICSALYFLGQWEKPFFDGITRRRPFFPDGRTSSNSMMVDIMSNGGAFPYYKDSNLGCEIMGFPYKGNKTTMYVILPQNSNKETLKNFETRLTSEDVERLVENTKYTQAVIGFPKMKLETTVDLRDALEKMGARSLFNPHEANLALLSPGFQTKATVSNIASKLPLAASVVNNPIAYNIGNHNDDILIFSRIGTPVNCTLVVDPNNNATKCENVETKITNNIESRLANDRSGLNLQDNDLTETLDSLRNLLNSSPNAENPGLYADQVLHKVYVDITETGTEAAAATSVSLSRGGDIVTFRVDVPFLFFIRDEESKLVLFWGSVTTPTPSFP